MSNIIATMLLSVSRLVSHPMLAVVCYISNIVQSNTFTCKTYVPTLCGRIQFCSHNVSQLCFYLFIMWRLDIICNISMAWGWFRAMWCDRYSGSIKGGYQTTSWDIGNGGHNKREFRGRCGFCTGCSAWISSLLSVTWHSSCFWSESSSVSANTRISIEYEWYTVYGLPSVHTFYTRC